MGRPSDGKSNDEGKVSALSFTLPLYKNTSRDLTYVFKNQKLDYIAYSRTGSMTEKMSNKSLELEEPALKDLGKVYGPPRLVTQQGPEPRRESYTMLVWERPANAVILVLIEGTMDRDALMEIYVVVPFDPSGYYDRFTKEFLKLKETFERYTRIDAEPLDIAFLPGLHHSLSFGDPADKVVMLMGYSPYRSVDFEDNTSTSYYILPTTGELIASVSYFFQDKLLHHIMLGDLYSSPEDLQNEFFHRTAATPSRLEELYGQPKTKVKRYPGPGHQDYQILIWERPNNAVVYMPPVRVRNNSLSVHILVCPLDPSGDYDLALWSQY